MSVMIIGDMKTPKEEWMRRSWMVVELVLVELVNFLVLSVLSCTFPDIPICIP